MLITFERKVIIYYYRLVRRDKICDNEKTASAELSNDYKYAENRILLFPDNRRHISPLSDVHDRNAQTYIIIITRNSN